MTRPMPRPDGQAATASPLDSAVSGGSQQDLVRALRAGDETAFTALVDTHTPMMLRIARGYVATAASAEEVVQETWLALLNGLDRFEERSSLKTWLFRVLVNIALTRSARDSRTTPFSAFGADADNEGPTVDPARFAPAGAMWPGGWTRPPGRWNELPEQALLTREMLACVQGAVSMLPKRQRAVIELRDFAGFTAEDVCDLLEITPGNQRVLLHRARARIREVCEEFIDTQADHRSDQ